MKPLRWLQACACLIAVSTVASPLSAQFGYFGQNKIQYRKFDWRVLRGEHVDLYYYPEEEELGRVALAYAEESYDNLERRFNHAVTRRIPLIVYASHTDFEQTNILPFIPPEGLLGVTEFMKRRVTLPFRGSYAEFRHTIRHELVHVFQLSIASQTFGRYPRFRQIGIPLWWTEGLAEFFSAGEDSRDEMILRDMTVSGRLPTLSDLEYAYGGLVYPVAHSGAVQRHLETRELRCGDRRRVRPAARTAFGGMAVLDAPALLPGHRQSAAARDQRAQTDGPRDQADGVPAPRRFDDLLPLLLAVERLHDDLRAEPERAIEATGGAG